MGLLPTTELLLVIENSVPVQHKEKSKIDIDFKYTEQNNSKDWRAIIMMEYVPGKLKKIQR